MRGHLVEKLLSLPVRMHGIALGRPIDVLLDASASRVVGFEVVCRDGAHRFMPLAVADIRPDEIAVGSALMLLEERDLDYYRRRTRRIGELKLARPCIDEDGTVGEAQNAA